MLSAFLIVNWTTTKYFLIDVKEIEDVEAYDDLMGSDYNNIVGNRLLNTVSNAPLSSNQQTEIDGKIYLKKYGYLPEDTPGVANQISEDQKVKAIVTFQKLAGLNETGCV